jgi:hypothetical protein
MSEILPTTLISRVDGLLATEVDGETVLMHLERGQYFGLARTGQRIWQLLETPCAFDDLCGMLQRDYAGPADLIRADAQRFVQQMAEEALVTLA